MNGWRHRRRGKGLFCLTVLELSVTISWCHCFQASGETETSWWKDVGGEKLFISQQPEGRKRDRQTGTERERKAQGTRYSPKVTFSCLAPFKQALLPKLP